MPEGLDKIDENLLDNVFGLLSRSRVVSDHCGRYQADVTSVKFRPRVSIASVAAVHETPAITSGTGTIQFTTFPYDVPNNELLATALSNQPRVP